MQRLFSMFPHGAPGLALVLLRVAVSLHVVVLQSALVRATGFDPDAVGWGSLVLVTLLLVGYGTPVTAGIVALLCAAAMLVQSDLITTTAIATAGALALIGPGAYSLDARRFGRRRWSTRGDRHDV